MKKIILVLCVAVVSLGITSCNQDNLRETYDVNNPPAVGFMQPVIAAELTPEFNGVITVIIARTNTDEAVTVPIQLTSASTLTTSLFTLASTEVSFASGEAVAEAQVQFALDDLDAGGTQYSFSVGFTNPEQVVSQGGNRKMDITATRKLTYVKVETPGIFSSAPFGGDFEFVLYRAVEAPSLYKMEFFTNTIDFSIDPEAGTAAIPAQDLGEDLFGVASNSWIECTAGTYSNGVCTFGGGTWANAYWTSSAKTSGIRMVNERIILPAGAY